MIRRTVLLVMAGLLLFGCAGSSPAAPSPLSQSIPLQTVTSSDWPPAVRQWAGERRERPAQESMTIGDWTYLLVAAGVKPTGGYSVEFVSANQRDGQIVVQARVKSPPPGSIVTQALTYPVGVARIPKTTLPIIIEVR